MRKQTLSICDACHNDCPAEIIADGAVTIRKACECGHTSEALIDPNVKYFQIATDRPPGIYSGLLIDVTDACNISCKYCYHGGKGDHKEAAGIISYAKQHQDKAPYILTGGEPTIHPDIAEIYTACSAMAETIILTNGTLAIQLFEQLQGVMTLRGHVMFGLSLHPESLGADFECLNYFKAHDHKIESVLCVAETVDDVLRYLDQLKPYRTNIGTIRIKAATNSGETSNASNQLYVSDMVLAAVRRGNMEIYSMAGKYRYFNAKIDGGHVAFMRWPELHNIDLLDLRDTPPFYQAKDGQLYNLAESLVRNKL